MKKLIVFDSGHPLAVKNKCFDPSNALQGAGYFLWPALFNEAAKNNISCITADVFLEQPDDGNQIAYCISEMVTPNTDAVLKKGAIPLICYCLESPIVARSFYHSLQK